MATSRTDTSMTGGANNITPWQRFGMGALGAGMTGAGIYGAASGHPDAGKAAMPYLNQIPGTVSPYYQPGINAGNAALPKIQGQFDQLMNNPAELMKQFGGTYQQSPGYQWKMGQGEQGINNAYAAGGMAGSPEHQQRAGEMASHIADQDYNDYMKNIMGLYGMGLQGEQGLYTQGAGMSDQLAQLLGGNLAQQAGLKYSGVANQNQAQAQDQSNIFGGLGAIAAALLL